MASPHRIDKQIMLNTALNYMEKLHFSVIPVRKDKKPLLSWEQYQKKIASKEEIEGWWQKWPEANIGIVTGKISGIVVVDIDTIGGKLALKEFIPSDTETPTAHTQKGQHLYFRYPADQDKPLSNNARKIKGCDFRGDGGYVVAPPSIGENGNYAWIEHLEPSKVPFAVLPEDYIKYIIKGGIIRGGIQQANQHKVNKVNRCLMRVAGTTIYSMLLTS